MSLLRSFLLVPGQFKVTLGIKVENTKNITLRVKIFENGGQTIIKTSEVSK